MGPARERLGAGDRPVRERNDRLVGDRDRVVSQRAPQVALQPRALAHRAAGGLVEARELRAAGVLGLIDGRVGAAHERLCVVPGTRRGDTEARGHSDLVAGHAERSLEGAQQPRADRLPARAVQERHELVAAEACQQRRRARMRAKPLGHRDQQGIADGVPAAVVDGLEVIEVDERDGAQVALRRRERGLQPRGEQAPVRQPGQRVVAGGVPQPRLAAPQAIRQ